MNLTRNPAARFLFLFLTLVGVAQAHAWQRVTNGLPSNPYVARIHADGSLAALIVSDGTPTGVHISTNAGASWFKAPANLSGSGQIPTAVLVVGNTIYVARNSQSSGANAVLRSSNYGTNWQGAVGIPNNTSLDLLATDGTNLFAAKNGNGVVWRSSDGGTNWTAVSSGPGSFNNGSVRSLGARDGRAVVAATTGVYLLSGPGTNWVRASGDGNATGGLRMAWQGGKTFFAYGDAGRRVLAVLDGVTNVVSAGNGLPSAPGSYRDLAASSAAVFASAQLFTPEFLPDAKIFQTIDGGGNWMEIQRPAANADPASMCVISNTLFLGVGGSFPSGLFRASLIDGVPFFAPAISGLPENYGVHPGTNIVLSPLVSGEGSISMQWFKDGQALPGETSAVLSLPNVQTNQSGNYSLIASNAGGATVSSAVKLAVIPRSAGSPNLDFNPGFFASDNFGTEQLYNATVFAVAALTNGQIMVGGNFTHVNADAIPNEFTYTNGVRRHGIARLNADGSADLTFAPAPGIEAGGRVGAIAVQSNGQVLLAGEFNNYNGISQTNVTRVNPDGSHDSSFATNAFNNGANIWRVEVQPDGKILIAGSFSSINGQTRLGVARLESNGALDTTWPVGTGVAGSVNDIAVLPDNQVLVGGSFGSVNGVASRKYLTLLDSAGAANTAFNHGLNSTISEIEIQPGGMIWAGGTFSTYSNGPVTSVVRLAPNGSLVNVADTNISNPDGLVVQQDGKLILSSYYSAAFEYPLMRLGIDASRDPSFVGGTFDIAPQSMALSPSGDLYAAGTFSRYFGLPVKGVVKIYATETNVPPQAPQIISHPRSLFALFGSDVTLFGTAAGAQPLAFSWLKDGAVLDGAVSSTLTLTNFSALQLGDYQLVASNSFGSVTSLVATVSTATAPSIVQDLPAFSGSTNGGTVALQVDITGTAPFGFQWYRNSGSQFGLTNNPLVLSNLNASITGNWYVIVTNAYGRATSSISSVQTGNLPVVQAISANQTLNGEGNVTLSVTANAASTTPLTFSWYHNNTLVRAQTTNLLVNAFTITNALPTNSGSYYVVIQNFVGSVTSLTRTVTIRNPFLAQLASITAVQGIATNLSAAASGTAPIDFYWYRRSFGSAAVAVTNFVGTGATLGFNPLARSDGQYNYFVVASNVWGTATSSLAAVTVQYPIAITNISATAITSELNSQVSFFVQYEAQPNPDIRWYKDGQLQPQLFNASVFLPSVQASNGGTYQLVLSNFINSVTSAPIVLTILPPRPPTITNHPPASRLASTAAALQIPVGVDGTPVMYFRWFRGEGTPVSQWQTASALSLSPLTTNDSGSYYVVVTNNYGSATSAVSAVTVIAPQPPSFANKQFAKVADSLTIVPGMSPVRFHSFRDVFIRSGHVWFAGNGGNGTFATGVHHWSNNVLNTIVGTNTLVPGTSSRFTNFYGSTFLSAGRVVFAAFGSGDEHGIYAWTNGSVIKIHDRDTVIPGRSETFDRFGWPAVAGNQFAFFGFSEWNDDSKLDYRGLFVSSNGVLTKLADTNTVLPGLGGHFVGSSSQVAFDGQKVAWWAWNEDDDNGIFTVTRQLVLTNIADTLTINPANGQVFDGFISPASVHAGRVYFVGHDLGFNTALFYRDQNGATELIAKPGDTIPGRGMAFDSIAYPAQIGTAAGNFFTANDGAGYTGIFFWNGSSIVKVIDSFDSLDGQNISYVFVGDAEGTDVAFYVGFVNGRQAIYAMTSAGGESFSGWASNYSFPPGQSDPEDDADGDGIKNAFEFYFGSNPTSAASGAMPSGTSVNVGGQNYPAITFVRSKNAGGVTMLPQASSDLNFSNSLGTVIESVVDLGNGTERVTVRSTVNSATHAAQFLRIQLEIP
ncbi:MAG TPA: hypothetical protein VEH04_11155 [Verrucomicrobiae bacterium]|nr:hypothetical protein [Verrucomicrobiae bacterium]